MSCELYDVVARLLVDWSHADPGERPDYRRTGQNLAIDQAIREIQQIDHPAMDYAAGHDGPETA